MEMTKPRIPEGGSMDDSSEMTAAQYSDTMKKMLGKRYELFAEEVINKVSPVPHGKVLEIGPGPGWGGISLLKRRPDLHLDGLEPSADMVATAIENVKAEGLEEKANFFVGMGEEMSAIADAAYDLVISRESLHHWLEPERVFMEIARVLRSAGKICIYDHRRDMNWMGKAIVATFGALKAGKMAKYWKSSIAASYTPAEIRVKLDALGLEDWEVEADLMHVVIYKR